MMDITGIPTFEITAKIGCKIMCKYCAQELIVPRYHGVKVLSFDAHEELTKTIPAGIPFIRSGVSEPFLNPETPDMILSSYFKGHPAIVYSTLVDLKMADAVRLCTIRYGDFVIHEPDGQSNAHIPLTDEYLEVKEYMKRHLNTHREMNMGEGFATDHNEDFFRGNPIERKIYPITCFRWKNPHYTLSPNGDVHFCCMCKGMAEKVGSLWESTYQELEAKHRKIAKHLKDDPYSICHYCSVSQPIPVIRMGRQIKDFVTTAVTKRVN